MPAYVPPEGSSSASPDPPTPTIALPSQGDDLGANVDLHPDFAGPGNVVIVCKDDDDDEEEDRRDVGFLVMGHILRVVSPTFNDFLALTDSRIIEVDDTPDDMHAFLRILNVRPDNPTAFAASAEHFLAARSLMDKYCCGPHIVGVLYRAAEMRAAQIIARVDSDRGRGYDRVGAGDLPDDPHDGGSVHPRTGGSGAGEPAGDVGPNRDVQVQAASVPTQTDTTPTTATATKLPATDETTSTTAKPPGNGSHSHRRSPPPPPSQYRTKAQAQHCLTLAHSLRSHTLWREVCTALHTRPWWRDTLNPVTLTQDDIDTVGADVFRVLVLLAMMGSVDGLFDRVEQLAVGYNKSGEARVVALEPKMMGPPCECVYVHVQGLADERISARMDNLFESDASE